MESLSLSTDFLRMPQITSATQLFLGVVVLLLIIILAAHTFVLLGRHTFLYRKKPPVNGWNKRFYPAIAALLAFVSGLLWALHVYRSTL